MSASDIFGFDFGLGRRLVAVGLALACGVVRPATASAETGQGESTVEDQIAQGIGLRRAGNDQAALRLFLDLEKRNPDSVRLLLHITTAALATGKWTTAFEYMQRASAHKEDPYYQRHLDAIENIEHAIAQHVGQFRARGTPSGAEVRLSGEVIGTLPMEQPRALEVGSYVLEVSRPGYFSVRRPITIGADGSLTQEDVDLRELPVPTSSPTGTSWLLPTPEGERRADEWWRARWVTWSFFGAALAAGTASGISFGVRAAEVSHWNSISCLSTEQPTQTRGNLCGPTLTAIHTAQDVGIATGAVALVFGGATLVHWLAFEQRPEIHRSASVNGFAGPLFCDPGLGGVICRGSF